MCLDKLHNAGLMMTTHSFVNKLRNEGFMTTSLSHVDQYRNAVYVITMQSNVDQLYTATLQYNKKYKNIQRSCVGLPLVSQ